MSGPAWLDRARIQVLLRELAQELADRGTSAVLFVVGGAAMALAHDDRRATADVDATFQPSPEVRAAAAAVAGRHGLAPDWLNDGAKGFMPGPDTGATVLFELPSLRVELASAEYLLAMKVMAARVEQDVDDLRALYVHLGLETVDQGLEIAERYYGSAGMQRVLQPRSAYVLAAVVEGLPRGS